MIAKTLEELQVYQLALDIAAEIIAILKRPAFARDVELKNQLDEASQRIPPVIGEGFGQQSDRHFASYSYRARGSANEVRAHLAVAQQKNYITAKECADLCARYVIVGKMLTRPIQHLRRENRRLRG